MFTSLSKATHSVLQIRVPSFLLYTHVAEVCGAESVAENVLAFSSQCVWLGQAYFVQLEQLRVAQVSAST